jgi:glycerol-3-phosphate acyltransferase PlsY
MGNEIMMSIREFLVCVIAGYCFGMIPNGYLYAKSQGVNIYKVGSGNPGSTNISRTLGKRAGATVLLLDIAKTIVPIFFMSLLWKPVTMDQTTMLTLVTGAGAIVGHDFPVIPGLHGGKGIACTGALVIAFDWRLAIVLFAFFLLVSWRSGYVSVGSISAVTMFFILTAVLGYFDLLMFTKAAYPYCVLIVFLISALAVWQHRSNIKRLRAGTESKFHFKK